VDISFSGAMADEGEEEVEGIKEAKGNQTGPDAEGNDPHGKGDVR